MLRDQWEMPGIGPAVAKRAAIAAAAAAATMEEAVCEVAEAKA